MRHLCHLRHLRLLRRRTDDLKSTSYKVYHRYERFQSVTCVTRIFDTFGRATSLPSSTSSISSSPLWLLKAYKLQSLALAQSLSVRSRAMTRIFDLWHSSRRGPCPASELLGHVRQQRLRFHRPSLKDHSPQADRGSQIRLSPQFDGNRKSPLFKTFRGQNFGNSGDDVRY